MRGSPSPLLATDMPSCIASRLVLVRVRRVRALSTTLPPRNDSMSNVAMLPRNRLSLSSVARRYVKRIMRDP